MFKVHTQFENCYGIKKLQYIFDFSKKTTYAVYSPNGTMKTSFSKVFMDFSQSIESSDLVFTERNTVRSIKNEDGSDFKPDDIFVIEGGLNLQTQL